MNKFFFDTEFIEGFTKPLFNIRDKPRHFIDLISIGIKAQNGNEYYAISTEFNPDDADKWVQDNVLSKLPARNFDGHNASTARLWKSNKQIAEEVRAFVYRNAYGLTDEQINYLQGTSAENYFKDKPDVEFYSYYADYDWVLLCSLFGRMIDLPKGFPMYALDIKQMMHEDGFGKEWKNEFCPEPKEEHHALTDAIWHKKLYDTIMIHRSNKGL